MPEELVPLNRLDVTLEGPLLLGAQLVQEGDRVRRRKGELARREVLKDFFLLGEGLIGLPKPDRGSTNVGQRLISSCERPGLASPIAN